MQTKLERNLSAKTPQSGQKRLANERVSENEDFMGIDLVLNVKNNFRPV